MDVIFISDLRVELLIGVYPREKAVAQKLRLDLEIGLPGRGAAGVRALRDTLDYAAVVSRIEASLAEDRFDLLENLAEHVASLVLREFGSPWVKVSVAKLAPLRNVQRLGVTIERGARQ
jgi:dihydroneopterin aldolase